MDSLDGRGIWRTIDSAPKDGTAVMVVWQDLDGHEHQGACWNNGTGWYPFNRPATHWHPLQPLPSTSPQPAPSDGKEDGSSGVTEPLAPNARPSAPRDLDLTATYKPVAVHFTLPDRLEYISRDVPHFNQAVHPSVDVLIDQKTREPIGWCIYGWSKVAPSSEAQPECSERSSDPTLSGTNNKTSDGWMQEVVEVLTEIRDRHGFHEWALLKVSDLIFRLRGASHG